MDKATNELTNELMLRVQPDEAIYLKINNKVPGLGMGMDRSALNLLYSDRYSKEVPDAYERLMLDAIQGRLYQRDWFRSSRLTAREKLRAVRVLSRKIEPNKPDKLQLGSQVLANLRESDKGKSRPGLPEAPTNLLDDSKRGMPKKGLTFELPGGREVFFIIFSVVFITTVMFTTTYIVWKVGAIHFNEQ